MSNQASPEQGQQLGFQRLYAACESLPAPRTAVAHPCSIEALRAAREAHDEGLIHAILVAPPARLQQLAADSGVRIDDLEQIASEHSVASAAVAVALVRAGKADAVMKGSLHTDELLLAVLDRDLGLRTGRRASHVFVVEVPGFPRPLLVTDAVINIGPGLAEKADICQNAIELALLLGIAQPRLALLAPVETVNPKIPSTLDAAKWPTAGRSSVACWTGHWLSIPRSTRTRRGSRTSPRRLPATRTSWSPPTSRAATSWSSS
jgi:phosphotransacetylase